jgi:prevent-host-death family protein
MGKSTRVWQLHEAKARFSELFRLARAEGVQRVVKQGGGAVIVIPEERYEQLLGQSEQPASLVEFFRRAPEGAAELELDRSGDETRDIVW